VSGEKGLVGGRGIIMRRCEMERRFREERPVAADHPIHPLRGGLTASHASSTFRIGTYFVSWGSRSWSRTESDALPSPSTSKMSDRRVSPVVASAMVLARAGTGRYCRIFFIF
jgi:hypothetical protein